MLCDGCCNSGKQQRRSREILSSGKTRDSNAHSSWCSLDQSINTQWFHSVVSILPLLHTRSYETRRNHPVRSTTFNTRCRVAVNLTSRCCSVPVRFARHQDQIQTTNSPLHVAPLFVLLCLFHLQIHISIVMGGDGSVRKAGVSYPRRTRIR